ncbi:uncharacterized protein LOC122658939 isoform X2 [Telopea speciosissima]|uniref:uncharacterized protein LOC122658939 isoform X2 n=1 Tax=Telopea speciosissima TaxID=54955 RepID=UPI001CC3FD9F|nr:uncharacterized protein LOC122658939 isoform X2 [Telopea speciosissima]
MGISSICFKFSIVLSLSLAVSSSSASSSTTPKASASDILSLLGSREQASTVNPKAAQELRSCFKFLVPFHPVPSEKEYETFCIRGRNFLSAEEGSKRKFARKFISDPKREQEDELVWWPPEPVMELARIAVDSGGDPAAIQRILDPTPLPVPDVEGSIKDRCELTRTPYGRRFINEELNSYLAFLFEVIAARGPSVGLTVSLNRYDFFHGHLFLAADSGRLGKLFHAKEYPAYEKVVFPYNMGFCQIGSNVRYDDSMNLRNILWLAPLPSNSTKAWLSPGVLVVLDAYPGGIIYKDIIPDYVQYARTIYEDDFGDVVVDVNYLNIGEGAADYKIFIC